MRPSWIIPLGPNWNGRCPFKRWIGGDTDTQGRGPCEDGGEMAVIQPQSSKCQQPPAGGGRKVLPQSSQREHGPAHTLILDCVLENCEKIDVWFLKLPACTNSLKPSQEADTEEKKEAPFAGPRMSPVGPAGPLPPTPDFSAAVLWPDFLRRSRCPKDSVPFPSHTFPSLTIAMYSSPHPPPSSCTWPLQFLTGRKVVALRLLCSSGVMRPNKLTARHSWERTWSFYWLGKLGSRDCS